MMRKIKHMKGTATSLKLAQWLRRRFLRQTSVGKLAGQQPQLGFTLLELLIALLIGSVIMSGLMFLVTEMLRIERRETAVDNTQRDMKRAMEYIATDVAEAVYIYVPDPADGWADAIDELVGRPNSFTSTDNLVLAFWRPDFVEDEDLPDRPTCLALSDPQQRTDCLNLIARRAFYSLIVYEVVPNDGNGVWQGQARLVRYRLPKYRETDPDLVEGYAGSGAIVNEPGFDTADWLDPDENQPDDTLTIAAIRNSLQVQSDVLVDFLADPADPNIPEDTDCGGNPDLIRIPEDAAASRSFFTCVRNPQVTVLNNAGEEVLDASGDPVTRSENQNLELFLRGDFTPFVRPGEEVFDGLRSNTLNRDSTLPTLRTGVFVQGIIGYNP